MTAVKTHKIALLPGDGIGPEVIAEACKVTEAAGAKHGFNIEWVRYPFGSAHYLKTNEILPESALNEMGQCDAMLLGAVGSPSVKPGILERGLLLKLRFHFDQYINLRPALSYPRVPCPVPLPKGRRIDSVVVRENTEDFYVGVGGLSETNRVDCPVDVQRGLYTLKGQLTGEISPDDTFAMQIGFLSRKGIDRVTRYAFELAKKRGEKTVTLASKANAVPQLYGFLDRETVSVAADYPGMELKIVNVDALCYHLVRRPADFGVILCPNLFGDIVSDLQSALTGGLGLGAGGNIGRGLSMFEPVHGSAPDIAGTGKANPLAAISCASLMLDHVQEHEGAKAIRRAIETMLDKANPKEMPVELGGEARCSQVGELVTAQI